MCSYITAHRKTQCQTPALRCSLESWARSLPSLVMGNGERRRKGEGAKRTSEVVKPSKEAVGGGGRQS